MSNPRVAGENRDGVPFMVKRGVGDQASQRRHEAEILKAARHPGVVELLSSNHDGDAFELRLAQVAGRDLLDQPPMSSPDLARVLAEVAQTLTDLHDLGIVHGNIGAEHIIIDRHLHTTICGFGNARWSRPDDDEHGLEPELDITSLGRILDHELTRSVANHRIDDREPLTIGLRHVAELADSASADHQGISMSDIAYRLHQLAGGPPRRPVRHDLRSRHGLLDRIRTELDGTRHLVVGLATAVLIVATSWLAWSAARSGNGEGDTQHAASPTVLNEATPRNTSPRNVGPDEGVGPSATAEVNLEPVSTSTPTRPTLIRPAVAPPCPTWDETEAETADVDGDGCKEPWWRTGAVLTVGRDRYSLGSAEDLIALGDWDCDGVATPALIDISTGSVYLFEQWAHDRGSTTAIANRQVPDATSATATRVASCDILTITTALGLVTVNGAPA